MKIGRKRAVAPVLATLMMIAVAVAMSVIIFVWSQNFLGQTSQAAGGQQSQQNLAASSGISIEAAIFTPGTGSGASVVVVVRNVGSVSETLGSFQIQGAPSNTGFSGSDVCTFTTSTSSPWLSPSCSANGGSIAISPKPTSVATSSMGKSQAFTLTYTPGTGSAITTIASGDSLNIKVSTTVGTFANQQSTVP